jgi:hypothetical protein
MTPRSDDEIRDNLALPYPNVQLLVDDALELLARAVAAETEAQRLAAMSRVETFIGMQVDRDIERVKRGHAERERDALRAAALAGAAPEGDPPQPVERFARTKMIDCFDCGQPYPGEHRYVGPHLVCPPVAAVVQATPEQDTQR